MINFIQTTVAKYSNLEFWQNIGEDRIRNNKFKGSLWIKGRKKGFRLQTTSEIASILDTEIEKLHGNPVGEQKGYKYWHIDDYRLVEQIIEFLAKS